MAYITYITYYYISISKINWPLLISAEHFLHLPIRHIEKKKTTIKERKSNQKIPIFKQARKSWLGKIQVYNCSFLVHSIMVKSEYLCLLLHEGMKVSADVIDT